MTLVFLRPVSVEDCTQNEAGGFVVPEAADQMPCRPFSLRPPWAVMRAGIGNESDQVPEGRSVDAWARAGDEGRGTLRKAVGSCEQALIRGYPNGETHFQRSVIRRQDSEGASPLTAVF